MFECRLPYATTVVLSGPVIDAGKVIDVALVISLAAVPVAEATQFPASVEAGSSGGGGGIGLYPVNLGVMIRFSIPTGLTTLSFPFSTRMCCDGGVARLVGLVVVTEC